jgi:hypothetical protein
LSFRENGFKHKLTSIVLMNLQKASAKPSKSSSGGVEDSKSGKGFGDLYKLGKQVGYISCLSRQHRRFAVSVFAIIS